MSRVLNFLGSMHVAAVGLLALLLILLSDASTSGPPSTWFDAILLLLAVNLVAAVLVRPQFRRQPALLVFHLCLAALAAMLAAQSLTRFEGRVELAENQTFTPSSVEIEVIGRWHRDRLAKVGFTQGPVSVEYQPELRRGRTRSLVFTNGGRNTFERLGDTQPLLAQGYRFTVTPNKGFALALTWLDDTGDRTAGNIHLPSYPAREWEQQQSWMTPAGEIIQLVLEIPPAPSERAWVLDKSTFDGRAWLIDGTGRREELRRGESVDIAGGRLRLDDVVLWMGYRIESQGLLSWIFAAAFLGLTSLGWHLLRRPQRYRAMEGRAHAA